ncbi:MAG: UDP-N-acetylglucosamine 2-epimerase (non-hydrolyzing) [Acidobacteriaceae bacterium]|nr:UDP-N-acetylglucosamine 2-epimerase (non-hydrolyzing) [Acidobacteriaceae bacterium]
MTSPRDESPTATNSNPSSTPRHRILVILGTRPEAIKLAPVIQALRSRPFCRALDTLVCVTAQHRTMLDQVLNAFEIQPEFDLDVMRPGQALSDLSSRIIGALAPVFDEVKPSLAIVQGDTTTTICASLTSFYSGVPLAHVEAGLRTRDMQAPFPEEANRVLTSRLASLHFPPTDWAASNLREEGIRDETIITTGNTGIDALFQTRAGLEAGKLASVAPQLRGGKKLIVVTAHRRENLGAALDEICRAVLQLSRRDDIEILWPVHPNPRVRKTVRETVCGRANVSLLEPLDYVSFVDLIQRAHLIITDSGGIQEEAPSLGKPVLVLRETTERPEGVEAGTVKLVGTGTATIVREAIRLLDDEDEYGRMARIRNPYGDGRASSRIAQRISTFLGV